MANQNNTVKVVFEAVMNKFQKGVKDGISSISKMEGATKGVNKEFKSINDEVSCVNNSVDKLNTTIKTIAGAIVVKILTKTVVGAGISLAKEYAKTQTAIGEMASLGYESSELLRESAIKFTNKWAGTTREGFISAAYDIKSGIASLSDEGVAQFTELAGITAKATKSSIDEMTSLFATGYGIYRNMYSSDFEFGEAFSSGIAKAVQQFKTKGSEMSQYLSTLGASAAQAGAELSEVITVGGILQSTMTGSEAATKYNSFLKNAAKASKELGMNFLDANNRLLPAVEIIEKIKEKYGDILDAKEQMELATAFGDDESIKFITGLYDKTNDLRSAQDQVTQSINQGKTAVESMANTMNTGMGEKFRLIQQQWANLKDEIGKQMEPGITPALDAVSQELMQIQQSADFSSLGKSVGELVGVLGQLFTGVVQNMDGLVSSLNKSLNWLSQNFDTVKNTVLGLVEAFVAFKIAMAIAPIIQAVVAAIMAMGTATGFAATAVAILSAAWNASPLGVITVALLAIIGIIKLISKVLNKTKDDSESLGTTILNIMDRVGIKWNSLRVSFIKGIQDIVEHIPIIGDAISNFLDIPLASAERSLDKHTERLESRMNKGGLQGDDLTQDRIKKGEWQQDYYSQKYGNNPSSSTPSFPTIDVPSFSPSAAGLESKKKRTIKDDINDISDKYDHEVDLYDSRAQLAEKKKDTKNIKVNKQSMIQVLNKQLKDLTGLQGSVTGKDKNIVETAKNKILSQIADITSDIKDNVVKMVGDFNSPSGLTALTKYDYVTSTKKAMGYKYANTNNIEIMLNVKDLGKTSMTELNNKLLAIGDMAGGAFGGKNAMSKLVMQDVGRN